MTMRLSDIVARVDGADLRGGDCPVTDVVHRHDDVHAGVLFAAVRGANHDGHDYVADAVSRGAVAALVSQPVAVSVPQIVVDDVRATMGLIASFVHGEPSRDLCVFGVTGTNGKTTVTAFLEAACAAHGLGTGVIGTVTTRILGDAQPGVRTTPEATDLQRLFAVMHNRGVDAVAMEVSSHGLDLRRVDGTTFRTVLFTNLSQDHLDYHGSMDAYFAAKARLFTPGFASNGVIFCDDPWAQKLAANAPIAVVTVGFDDADAGPFDVQVSMTSLTKVTLSGTLLDGENLTATLTVPLPGRHNLANGALAVVAAALNGVPPHVACDGIAHAPGVPGRFEAVPLGDGMRGYVDFAHTPDAVRAVIDAARGLVTGDGRVILVVGCGGERDKGKRGPMGRAATGADVAVLTSDNPRSENPQAILDAIHAGAKAALAYGARCDVVVEVDRALAIGHAVRIAQPGDVIIVAGKGHEATQIFKTGSVPFDDRDVLKDAYASVKGH